MKTNGETGADPGDANGASDTDRVLRTPLTPFRAHLGKLSLNSNVLKTGSRGRTRTYNHTVNSRVLYH